MSKPAGLDGRSQYRMYLLWLLATILAFNGLDGTALGLVLPSIKHALDLTDTELGVLTGIAFSVFYSTVGIPISRWADRGDRVAIIALTTALWGIMVMLCGAARSFGELLIVRIGVAVGEAGCVPAAYSLIADYFPREERPSAVAKFLIGGSVSGILGYLAAGWLSSHYGWRTVFACIGVPSVLIAPVAWWTLSEPRRTQLQSAHMSLSGARAPRMLQVIQRLSRNRTFRYVLAMQCLNALFGSGLNVWQPSFYMRSYGFRPAQLGLYLAIVYGVGGVIGTYCGGYLASRYAPKNEGLQLRVFSYFYAAFGVVSAISYLSKDPHVSIVLLCVAFVGGCLANGPIFATTQTVVPESMRAFSISVIYLFGNLLGVGVGPLMVGALSDALQPYLGVESLRYALLAMCPGYFAAGWLLWQASRSVAVDVEAALARATESVIGA